MCLPEPPRILDPLKSNQYAPTTAHGFRQQYDPLRLTKHGGKWTDPMGIYTNWNPEQKGSSSGSQGRSVQKTRPATTNPGTGLQL